MNMRNIKCVVVGDGDVGKTSLLYRYTTKNFVGDYLPTEMENFSMSTRSEEKFVRLNIVDTAGQISYEKLRKHLYNDVDVFLICFSVVNQDSYSNIKDKWFEELNSHDANVPFILVGTKTDLREDEKTIIGLRKSKKKIKTKEHGFDLKFDLRAKKYLECSSLRGEGVKEVFEEVIKVGLQYKKEKILEGKKKKKANCVFL